MIQDIVNELAEIDTRDVLKDAIKEKLDRSLKLYVEQLNKSCEDILDNDCDAVVKKLTEKYTNYNNEYTKTMEDDNEN